MPTKPVGSFCGKEVATFLASHGYETHPKGMASSVCESDDKDFWFDVNADAVRRKTSEVPDRPLRIRVHKVDAGGGQTRLEMKSVEELPEGVESKALDRQPETPKINAPWPDWAENERLPRSGDTLKPQNWKVDYAAEGVVWFRGQANPIPIEHLAPVPGERNGERNVWRLIRISSTSDL